MRGDADMAIEYLIAEQSGEPSPVRCNGSDLSESGANGILTYPLACYDFLA